MWYKTRKRIQCVLETTSKVASITFIFNRILGKHEARGISHLMLTTQSIARNSLEAYYQNMPLLLGEPPLRTKRCNLTQHKLYRGRQYLFSFLDRCVGSSYLPYKKHARVLVLANLPEIPELNPDSKTSHHHISYKTLVLLIVRKSKIREREAHERKKYQVLLQKVFYQLLDYINNSQLQVYLPITCLSPK